MIMIRSIRPIFLYLLILLILVGCSPAATTLEPDSTSPIGTAYPGLNDPSADEAYPDPAAPADSGTPADQSGDDSGYPIEAADPTAANEIDATPALPAIQSTSTPRAELEASDPTGFTLASGELQLVEFFAFW
jgi:hypothetical protein